MDALNLPEQIFLPKNIRCLRKQKNMSQGELAGHVGLNRGNIASYENGTAEPKICNLLKLARFFNISIVDLTQKDLSKIDLSILSSSNGNGKAITPSEVELIEQFGIKAEKLQNLFESLHICYSHKAESLDEKPKDVQIMLAHFDQLYEASQSLLCEYQELLKFIKCKV
jgi:transcriptional regulator with XRE-family HTH domain